LAVLHETMHDEHATKSDYISISIHLVKQEHRDGGLQRFWAELSKSCWYIVRKFYVAIYIQKWASFIKEFFLFRFLKEQIGRHLWMFNPIMFSNYEFSKNEIYFVSADTTSRKLIFPKVAK
jgi:hypothetical protein